MSVCDPPIPPREFSSKPAAEPVLGDCLIREPQELVPQTFSANRETDARTALKRGLADYLLSLPSFTHPVHQRQVKLKNVFDVWPDQEDKSEFPSAAVYSTIVHPYEPSGFTPIVDPNCKVDDMTYLVKYAEVSFNITIDILTTDPEERVMFGMQMEDALNPVDWMYGFKLRLPHYHNSIGVYELMDGNYPDDEPSVFRRNRHLVYTVKAQGTAVRLKKIAPLTEVRTNVTVVDGNDPC